MAARILMGVLLGFVFAVAPGQTPRQPIILEPVEDLVFPKPPISSLSGVLGVMVERNNIRTSTSLIARLMIPTNIDQIADQDFCVTAVSRDGRYRYKGKGRVSTISLVTGSNDGIPIRSDLKQESIRFLRDLRSGDLAMLAELARCDHMEPESSPRTIVALDASPEEKEKPTGLKFFLASRGSRMELDLTSLLVGAKARSANCSEIVGNTQSVMYDTECRVDMPSSGRYAVTIRRHRPFNTPVTAANFQLIVSRP